MFTFHSVLFCLGEVTQSQMTKRSRCCRSSSELLQCLQGSLPWEAQIPKVTIAVALGVGFLLGAKVTSLQAWRLH